MVSARSSSLFFPFFFLKNCSLIPSTVGGVKVKSVSAAPGPSWTVHGSFGSLLVQSYIDHPVGSRAQWLWEFLCSVIICDQAFDMWQFLMEVLATFLFFPIPWKLLHTEGGGGLTDMSKQHQHNPSYFANEPFYWGLFVSDLMNSIRPIKCLHLLIPRIVYFFRRIRIYINLNSKNG